MDIRSRQRPRARAGNALRVYTYPDASQRHSLGPSSICVQARLVHFIFSLALSPSSAFQTDARVCVRACVAHFALAGGVRRQRHATRRKRGWPGVLYTYNTPNTFWGGLLAATAISTPIGSVHSEGGVFGRLRPGITILYEVADVRWLGDVSLRQWSGFEVRSIMLTDCEHSFSRRLIRKGLIQRKLLYSIIAGVSGRRGKTFVTPGAAVEFLRPCNL